MKIELMSPAGDWNSLLAALESGADAVYLGLKKLNARRPAKNFTLYELKKAVTLAHQMNKKIYLTLNIDLKSNELYEAAEMMTAAAELKIDAIIIKEPALIYIYQNFFQDKLKMHYSTQNALCSTYGIQFAKKQEAERAVLAREMELLEIKAAAAIPDIEIEIFTEGSMCFSISGRCMMSSWVGGRSGNRGLCTAPCRILWKNSENEDTFFSMKDLSLIKFLSQLIEIKITALKIEGRLKNALWVRAITRIYRQAIDNFDTLLNQDDIHSELQKYSAREISSGHLFHHEGLTGRNENWQKYSKTEAILNESNNEEKNEIIIQINNNQLIIQFSIYNRKKELTIKLPPPPKKTRSYELNHILHYFQDEIISSNKIKFMLINDTSPEMPHNHFASSFLKKTADEIIVNLRNEIKAVEKMPELDQKLIDFIQPKKNSPQRSRILGELPDKIIISTAILPLIINDLLEKDYPLKSIVVSLDQSVEPILFNKLINKYQLILSIPPVLFEKNAQITAQQIKILNQNGFSHFEANSFTGIEILSSLNCNRYLGAGLSITNHLAAGYYYSLGFKSVYITPEADLSMFKALSSFTSGAIEAIVYGKIPLFQSRVQSAYFKTGTLFKDKFNVEIECQSNQDLWLFIAKTPLMLINNQIKSKNITFDSLTADLRYHKYPNKTLEAIFTNQIELKNTSTFNFYRKLV